MESAQKLVQFFKRNRHGFLVGRVVLLVVHYLHGACDRLVHVDKRALVLLFAERINLALGKPQRVLVAVARVRLVHDFLGSGNKLTEKRVLFYYVEVVPIVVGAGHERRDCGNVCNAADGFHHALLLELLHERHEVNRLVLVGKAEHRAEDFLVRVLIKVIGFELVENCDGRVLVDKRAA